MRSIAGSYVLILRSQTGTSVEVGRRGLIKLTPAYYLYVGSAFGPGGVRARVLRHSRLDKNRHWHIDYIRAHMDFVSAWYSYEPYNQEHEWADTLQQIPGMTAWAGIGCSDCHCKTHLFSCIEEPEIELLIGLPGKPIECWHPANP